MNRGIWPPVIIQRRGRLETDTILDVQHLRKLYPVSRGLMERVRSEPPAVRPRD